MNDLRADSTKTLRPLGSNRQYEKCNFTELIPLQFKYEQPWDFLLQRLNGSKSHSMDSFWPRRTAAPLSDP